MDLNRFIDESGLVSLQKAQKIEDPTLLALWVWHNHIKKKMLYPADGRFETPNAAKQWFADQAGKFGFPELKERALQANSFDDIQALGQEVINNKKVVDQIVNGIALGITDKKRAKEWNPVVNNPRVVEDGQVTDEQRDIKGELQGRGVADQAGGMAPGGGYGTGSSDDQGGQQGPSPAPTVGPQPAHPGAPGSEVPQEHGMDVLEGLGEGEGTESGSPNLTSEEMSDSDRVDAEDIMRDIGSMNAGYEPFTPKYVFPGDLQQQNRSFREFLEGHDKYGGLE